MQNDGKGKENHLFRLDRRDFLRLLGLGAGSWALSRLPGRARGAGADQGQFFPLVARNDGPFYLEEWSSLQAHPVPAWYQAAKFGIFIHWGVYSVPAYGTEWYPHDMYQPQKDTYAYHLAHYGDVRWFGYKDFIPSFQGQYWDPGTWAAIFKEAGARYAVLVAEHHDGFPMYLESRSEWNSTLMGPCRDIVSELAQEVRSAGLRFGVSSHRAEHWWYFNTPLEADVHEPHYQRLYGPAQPKNISPNADFLDDWLGRVTGLVDLCRPDLVYLDSGINDPVYEPYLRKFAADYYNREREWGEGVAINYKGQAFPPGAAVLDSEQTVFAQPPGFFWQMDTPIGVHSWGYIEKEQYKSVKELVHLLVDVVSKNGCLLLNVGPRPDGTLPGEQVDVLTGIGSWLRTNGEALYDASPWTIFGEGPHLDHPDAAWNCAEDIRYTEKNGFLYATCLGWPEGELRLAFLAPGMKRVSAVELLGSGPVPWRQAQDGLTVQFPAQAPREHAFVLKIA